MDHLPIDTARLLRDLDTLATFVEPDTPGWTRSQGMAALPPLVIGSQTNTVPGAGRFDRDGDIGPLHVSTAC